VIVYLDSSIVARAYLPDEEGHVEALELLRSSDIGRATGTWTRIEVSGALVRAGRAGRADTEALLAALDADLGPDGPITVISAHQEELEAVALRLVREHAIRAMDAWHVATATLTLPALAEPREPLGFASRDAAQSAVAATLGFLPI
jgi:predicted nucleic acid-binding protein